MDLERKIRAHHLPQSIRFLREHGVRATRIAAAFGDSPANINQIFHRAKSQVASRSIQFQQLKIDTSPDDPDQQIVQELNRESFAPRLWRRYEELISHIKEVRAAHSGTDFAQGYALLNRLRPELANARNLPALWAKSVLYENLAWFAMQMGRSRVSLALAKTSLQIARRLYNDSLQQRSYLIQLGDAALVASVSASASQNPHTTLRYIHFANEAKFAAEGRLGSEHLRQEGTALLQLGPGHDEVAAALFRQASKRMQKLREFQYPLSVQMAGPRQLYFLNPGKFADRSFELACDAATVFGQNSLQHVLATNWAAATLLKTGTDNFSEIERLLASIAPNPDQLGHQATVTRLLLLTRQVELRGEALDAWLRFALFENAFCDRPIAS